MNVTVPVSRVLKAPRRDWRFWAWLTAALMVTCVTIAFVSVLIDRNDWRDRFDEASRETGCRSRAAIFSDTAGAQAISIQGAGLAAAATGKDPSQFAEALGVAADNAIRALAARDDAVQRCTIDPTYEIPASVLRPIPPYPKPGGSP